MKTFKNDKFMHPNDTDEGKQRFTPPAHDPILPHVNPIKDKVLITLKIQRSELASWPRV